MPLVVPGITSKPVDKTEEWQNKLVGKTVKQEAHSELNFCVTDLPEQHRVITPGMLITKDHHPDRLNVHINEEGLVTHCTHATNRTNIKSSAQRGLKASLSSTYPLLKPNIDTIVPNKSKLEAMKVPGGKSVLYTLDSDPLFFSFDMPEGQVLLPHLRLVHRYPECFPSITVDRGAIPFVLRGAALMAPGLTSKGGRLPEPRGGDEGLDEDGRWSRELKKGEPVVVLAEGKQEACAVGVLAAGTDEIRQSKKGQVIEETHFLDDGLWKVSID